MRLVATCVSTSGPEIDAYDRSEREITVRQAMRLIGRDTLAEEFPDYTWGGGRGLRFSKDWHISAGSGVFRGCPTVVIHHSGIHHFFQ